MSIFGMATPGVAQADLDFDVYSQGLLDLEHDYGSPVVTIYANLEEAGYWAGSFDGAEIIVSQLLDILDLNGCTDLVGEINDSRPKVDENRPDLIAEWQIRAVEKAFSHIQSWATLAGARALPNPNTPTGE